MLCLEKMGGALIAGSRDGTVFKLEPTTRDCFAVCNESNPVLSVFVIYCVS